MGRISGCVGRREGSLPLLVSFFSFMFSLFSFVVFKIHGRGYAMALALGAQMVNKSGEGGGRACPWRLAP
jgi:hypothetical protein